MEEQWIVGTDTARGAAHGRVHVLRNTGGNGYATVAVAMTPEIAQKITHQHNSHQMLVRALNGLLAQVGDEESMGSAAVTEALATLAAVRASAHLSRF